MGLPPIALMAALAFPAFQVMSVVRADDIPVTTVPIDDAQQHGDNALRITWINQYQQEIANLSVLKDRDQRAYEYLCSVVQGLRDGFSQLENCVNNLQGLADRSLVDPLPLTRFLCAVRDYEQSREMFSDQIHRVGLFPSLRLEARSELSGEIRLDALQQHYLGQLNSQTNRANSLAFRLELPGGNHYLQSGLDTVELRNMQLLSVDEINGIREKILTLRMMKASEQNSIDQSINDYTKCALQTFVDTFGSSERYRTSSDHDGRVEAAKALRDLFWARAHIRAIYGIKIGCIPVKYEKLIFNADYLLSHVYIGNVAAWAEPTLQECLNRATEAHTTLTDKGAGEQSSYLRHLLVWVTGTTADEDAKKFIVDLVRSDLEQELALSRGGGLQKVRAAYRQRYYSSEENKAFYQQQAKLFFGEGDDNDPDAEVDAFSTGTLKGAIVQCTNALERVEQRLDQARKLQATLDQLTESSPTTKKRRRRIHI